MRTLVQLPEVPTGAIFNPERGFLSVVVPLERTNMVLNPLLRNNSTGWGTFNSSVLSGFAGNYYHGGFGASIQPRSRLGSLPCGRHRLVRRDGFW